jgi:hypothetical protein
MLGDLQAAKPVKKTVDKIACNGHIDSEEKLSGNSSAG